MTRDQAIEVVKSQIENLNDYGLEALLKAVSTIRSDPRYYTHAHLTTMRRVDGDRITER